MLLHLINLLNEILYFKDPSSIIFYGLALICSGNDHELSYLGQLEFYLIFNMFYILGFSDACSFIILDGYGLYWSYILNFE
jgi:hypothetical protein